MPTIPNQDAKQYLAEIGRAGGKSGKGKSKARSKEQAQAAARKRWENARKQIKGKQRP